jgi:2-oxoglutarate ferredoxin oxidoreductase subunit gamma
MERSVIFSGFGGQGLLFAGEALARAGMEDGLEVFWIPSYGPEMRGGTASCTVILSDEPIGSPVVDQADAVVALNSPSFDRFAPIVAPGGLLVVNESLVEATAVRDGVNYVSVPCTRLAAQAGDDRLVSVVALGALVARLGVVRAQSVHEALFVMVGAKRPELMAADLRAFKLGYEWVVTLVASG